MEIQRNCSNDFSPDTPLCEIRTDESARSRKICHSIQTYQTGLQSANQSAVGSSTSIRMDPDIVSHVVLPGETSATPREKGGNMESRKGKASFYQVGFGPASTIQPKRLFQTEDIGNSSLKCQYHNELNRDLFSDDQFYEGLDLDALEAEATELLRHNCVSPMRKRTWASPNPSADANTEMTNSPSFDLGI